MPQTMVQKLRIQSDGRIAVINARESEEGILGTLPGNVSIVDTLDGEFDQIIMFVRNRAELARLVQHAIRALQPKGLLWACFPKRSSGAQTDLTRDGGWDILSAKGFTAAPPISLDEIWSAFAFRRKAGPSSGPRRSATALPSPEVARYIDFRKRSVKAPPDLRRALGTGTTAVRNFQAAPFTHKKEYVLWILQARKPVTRKRRITETVRRLSRLRGKGRQKGT
jgi:hypothetical protein